MVGVVRRDPEVEVAKSSDVHVEVIGPFRLSVKREMKRFLIC